MRGNFPQAADLGLKSLLCFLLYVGLVVLVSLGSQLQLRSNPARADRLASWLGWLVPGQNYRVTRLAIHRDNFERADQIWEGVRDQLPQLPAGTALALAANYSASLSARGQYRKALELLKPLDATKASGSYRVFQALYWLNRAYYHFQLGELAEARDCLRAGEKVKFKSPPLRERLEGLHILLTFESGDQDETLRLLRQRKDRHSFSALLLAQLGQQKEAAERLPDCQSHLEPGERCYNHLARMWLASQPEVKRAELEQASQTKCMAGLVAWQGLACLHESGYLELARARDPESIWTHRAERAASGGPA